MDIKFKLIKKDNMDIILPLFYELDSSIPGPVLKARLSEMNEKGYECVGIYHEDDLIGICGLWILIKYYVGRHLEPDNVYIKPEYREQGIGKKLEVWLKKFALSRGCEAIELNCYIKNEKGRNYWEANEYQSIGLHYQKKLDG